jgi:hypothetical protein
LSERITLSLQKSLPLSDGSIELQYSVIWWISALNQKTAHC